MIYLDYNATTPTDPRVLDAMLPYFQARFANPSSIHRAGHEARRAVEKAREKLAHLVVARVDEVYFTSGGTEADNIAVKGVAFAQNKRKKIITSAIEHHAVLTTCEYMTKFGFEVVKVPVDPHGIIDLNFLEDAVDDNTVIISIMHANNEVGTVEPITEISKIAHRHGIVFHTDAVQTVGKLPIDIESMGIDMLSLSGHKFCGPKGTGALIARTGIRFDPLSHGGHHEHNKRAGTENVPGIVGLGKACEIAMTEMAEEEKRIRLLRDKLWNGIREKIPDLILNGHPEKRLANTLGICVRYVEGESLLLHLDMHGICASSGSACTSGSLEPSHVLLAMGIPHETAHGSIRFSLGRYTEEAEILEVIRVFPKIVEKLRVISPLSKK
ncbi:MAG: cysteine desulfurase NifS [candidate division WOR-3 bacterium]|nr:MAG: cysteine desulfurase NifS [candidate division WOR-3 bacterium]